MSVRGIHVTLVTFEKRADLDQWSIADATAHRFRAHSVDWWPLRYHKQPRIPATLLDLTHGWMRGVAVGLRSRVQVVHGRTFVGGLIGRAIATTLRVPFIYHAEGFYPDEMVDGGFWHNGSVMHRVAKALEERLYQSAEGLIVLSSHAARRLQEDALILRNGTPVIVVPSCVDLTRFRMVPVRRTLEPPIRLVYAGGVGGRYQLDRIGRFVAKLAEQVDTRLLVLTREPRERVAMMLRAGGLDERYWHAEFVPHTEVPERLASQDGGLSFLARGKSEIGCSPTKIGEYWACGLPVVTTAGVSDTDELIRRFTCGVVVPDHSDQAYAEAARRLQELLQDPGLRARCRFAAEEHYALEPACERQISLYRQLSSGRR
jgi:glycosyltransferase involved in cell wall biosynthesis